MHEKGHHMNSRNIQNGVEKLSESMQRRATESLTAQWRDLRNKIDSILLSTTTFKTDEVRKACHEIDDMPAQNRSLYITQKWGPVCCQKVEPLLLQLQFLEDKMR